MRRGDEIDVAQHALGVLEQRLAVFGRHHAGLAAHEDRVAEHFAQPSQRGADGWLRLIQPQRGLGDAALDQQRAQYAHEPDVEGKGRVVHGDEGGNAGVFGHSARAALRAHGVSHNLKPPRACLP